MYQHIVPAGMPIVVVDPLEVVQVQKKQGQVLPTLPVLQNALSTALKGHLVEEPGKGVSLQQLLELGVGLVDLPALGDHDHQIPAGGQGDG